MVNTIWFRFDLIRFRKDFSACKGSVRSIGPCLPDMGLHFNYVLFVNFYVGFCCHLYIVNCIIVSYDVFRLWGHNLFVNIRVWGKEVKGISIQKLQKNLGRNMDGICHQHPNRIGTLHNFLQNNLKNVLCIFFRWWRRIFQGQIFLIIISWG